MLRGCFATFVVVTGLWFGISERAYGDAPYCSPHANGPYCIYRGTVKTVYVNDQNLILIYFDTPLDLSQPTGAGISGVSSTDSAAYLISDNPEFAKMLFATALAAQSRNARFGIQTGGVIGGRLKIDRVWVDED